MKIANILAWALRLIILGLLIILIIDNRQTTTFNFLGIYSITLPLIVITLIFLVIGVVIGLVMNLFRYFQLKAKISMLEKELKKTQQLNNTVNN